MTGPVEEAAAIGTLQNGFIALKLYEFLRRDIHVTYLTDAIFHRGNRNPGLPFEKKIGFLQKLGGHPVAHLPVKLPHHAAAVPVMEVAAPA